MARFSTPFAHFFVAQTGTEQRLNTRLHYPVRRVAQRQSFKAVDDGTIGLVDFGCVKYLKPEVVRCYAQFWSRQWVHDSKTYAEIIRVIFGSKISPEDPRVRRCMNGIKQFYDEFHPLDAGAKPLEFADSKFMEGLTRLAKILIGNKFLSPEFVFLSRTESGMCNLLHILKARVATTQIVRKWMSQASSLQMAS